MGMGRSFHHWGAREQFLWGWGGRSTTGERGSSSYGDGEVVPPLGSEGAVLMGMGRSFHRWGAREQFLWGWGGRSTTGERGSSSYGDGEIVPPLGSEGAVLMGMGRSFHHWGAREQFLWGWGGCSTTGERGSKLPCGSMVVKMVVADQAEDESGRRILDEALQSGGGVEPAWTRMAVQEVCKSPYGRVLLMLYGMSLQDCDVATCSLKSS